MFGSAPAWPAGRRQLVSQIASHTTDISRHRASADLEQQVHELDKHLAAGTAAHRRVGSGSCCVHAVPSGLPPT